MITFYDLAANGPKTWSPNPWKTRYILNYKQLPYQTVYVEFPDIPRVSKEAGIGPSSFEPDGSPNFTIPAIVDDATGVALSDSYKIAEYLDKQYPDTPKAFPPGTEALQAAFYQNFYEQVRPLAVIFVPLIPNILNEPSAKYYNRTREVIFGKPLSQVMPVGEEFGKNWEKVTAMLDSLNNWYEKSSGKFLAGDQPSNGDFVVGGMFQGARTVCGEESESWKKLEVLNGGRWTRLLDDLEKYADVSK
ncbi:Beta-etherase [Leucoagaricus sp. SymC.cos]|nr:Beta-etherase [Leucoagaricus sp. SymC.cos]